MATAMCTLGYAQVDVNSATDGNFPTEVLVERSESSAPCSQEELTNGFENGFGNTNGTTEVADDFFVNADESFSLESFTFNMISSGDYPDVTVRVYEDNGSGLPGAIVADEVIVPTSETVIGSAFGRDVNEVVIDFPTPVELMGASGTGSTYWISVYTPSGTGADSFWETSTASSSTILAAFKDGTDPNDPWAQEFVDGGGNTVPMPPAAVWLLEGDCNPLSVEDNLLSQVSLFPNPVNDILNVRVPASIEITGATLYDILGKDQRVNVVNGQINVSALNRGVYILNLETSAGVLTQKIVKQ